MGKIFGAEPSKSGLYKASMAKVTINNDANAIFLQVNISIGRQLSPIATLGQGIHWASQPPQGQLTAQTIITNSLKLVNDLTDGTKCDAIPLTVNMSDAVCGRKAGTAKTLKIEDGYCSSVGFSLSGQQGYIGSDLTIMFTTCELT